jgi:PAS domain-containing protein
LVAFARDDGGRLREERIATVHRVAASAYVATLLNAAILVFALWGAVDAGVLAGWFGLVLVTIAVRLAVHLRFARARAAGRLSQWERRFALGALAMGALWAAVPAVLFPEVDPLRQMVVVFVVGGSIIGAMGVYGASPLSFYGFSALPFAAVVAQFFLQPGETYRLLGLMVIVFGAAMTRVYRQYHRNIVETLHTRFANEELAARQALGEARLRDAIESFPDAIAVWGDNDRLVVCNDAYARLHGRRVAPVSDARRALAAGQDRSGAPRRLCQRRGRHHRFEACPGSLPGGACRGEPGTRDAARRRGLRRATRHRALQPAPGADARLCAGRAAGRLDAAALQIRGALAHGG